MPTNKKLLITRPDHDPTTNYLYHWCKPVIDLATSKGYTVHDLAKAKANRADFNSHLRARKIHLIFFNGHGNEKTICGYLDEPLVQSGSDLSNMLGTLMYIRSCQVMAALGKELISSGVVACIGYARKFNFFRSTTHLTHPLSDPYAKFFLEPSNLVVTTILKGNAIHDAFSRSQHSMKKNLQRLLSGATTPDQRSMAFALYTNIKGQVAYGDLTARI
jgi:hypothetical protein